MSKMNPKVKVCVINGGDLATPLLFDALAAQSARGEYEFVLLGQDAHTLELVRKISTALIQASGLQVSLTISSDAVEAITNADFVINQVREGGLEGQIFRESFPRKYGIPGSESHGPGGFANALGNIPVTLDYCKLIAQFAPQAVLLNLSEPGGIVQFAIQKTTAITCIGVCNSSQKAIRTAAELVNKKVNDVQVAWFGGYQLGWLTSLKTNGQDRMPEVLEQAEKIFGLGVDPEIIRMIAAIPSANLAYYFHPDRILAATVGRTLQSTAANELKKIIQSKMEAWRNGDDTAFIRKLDGKCYQEAIAPVLNALAEKKTSDLIISIANDGAVSFLPDDAVIETQVRITDGNIGKPQIPEIIPAEVKNLTEKNYTYERLAVEAILTHDLEKAKQALLSNAMVQTFNQVKGILAEVWPEKAPTSFKLVSQEKPEAGEPQMSIPTLIYDEKAIELINPAEERFAVMTMEIPWKAAEKRITRQPIAVVYIEELDWYSLEAMEHALPDIDAVIGLGGGMATDAAKYVAWKRGIPVDAAPTITSVDAAVTKSVAARAGGHVTYIGYVVPRNVYIDYPIIMGAPKRLNRSGTGDILCAHTALFDWKLAADHHNEKYDARAAAAMQDWLDQIARQAGDIREVNHAGVRLIMDAFADISIICRRYGSSRPQEGADHTFAYNAEYQTGKHFLHGELVALGTYVIANLQGIDAEHIRSVFADTGLIWLPKDLDLTRNDFYKIMRSLNWYHNNFGRRYSILDEVTIDEKFLEKVAEKLEFMS